MSSRLGATTSGHAGTVRRSRPVHLPELRPGDGAALVRTLRRQEATDAVVLTRRAGRREIVTLLTGGVRGAITAAAPGGVLVLSRPGTPLPGPALSERELAVLRLISEGNTNHSVGERLGVSGLTIKSQLARIARKMGTGDRAEMVAVALRRGLIT